ncbi:winged helix-turn-helix transcriptional regulator [Methanorbis rubei]|uniref:HTH arsR-type domain-containing protein n=1 Tax=Methanorbis rubei TaxID=3028300 RepID=A0AAE4SBJ6_9EURY|nr:hypothetical protein [Methanocorpusculaceae archaeon Cs1]
MHFRSLKKMGINLGIPVLITTILFSCSSCCVSAEIMQNYTIGGIEVSLINEPLVPIDDGTEIHTVSDFESLTVVKDHIIFQIYQISKNTPFEGLVIILSPIIFILLGFFGILRFTSNKKREESQLPEKIISYIKNHPGCTQKQLIESMNCSRGSVCYHLNKLLDKPNKLQRIYSGSIPQYYLATVKDIDKDPLEEGIRQLLSRKKSGRLLKALYEHPNATRKELAASLNVLPKTIHWYIHTYADERIIIIEKNSSEYRYSLTNEATQIYERLTKISCEEPVPRAST